MRPSGAELKKKVQYALAYCTFFLRFRANSELANAAPRSLAEGKALEKKTFPFIFILQLVLNRFSLRFAFKEKTVGNKCVTPISCSITYLNSIAKALLLARERWAQNNAGGVDTARSRKANFDLSGDPIFGCRVVKIRDAIKGGICRYAAGIYD